MSAMIDEDRAEAPHLGLVSGFADGPPGGVPGDRAELWRRVLFTLGALFIYRIGAALPIAGLDPLAVRDFFAERSSGVLGLIQMSAGGGFRGIPIFALGIMPYVSAFIVVQLASRIVPQLGRLAAGGMAERARLNQYARILTVVLAAFQAIGIAFALEHVGGFVIVPELIFEATTVVTLVAGALFLMWLAEQISARGLGNGALLILAFGVAGRLPYLMAMHIEMYRNGNLEGAWLLALAAAMLAFLALVVFVERAERRVPIYDPAYEIGQGGPPGGYRVLSLKINPAGVMPALAAGIFIAPAMAIDRDRRGKRDARSRLFQRQRRLPCSLRSVDRHLCGILQLCHPESGRDNPAAQAIR